MHKLVPFAPPSLTIEKSVLNKQMSSHHDQRSKKRNKMESSSSTPAHFFRIILDHTIENKCLDIPKEFLKKFGNELSDSATIKVPSGSMWRIRLTKRRGVISFEDGWQQFMEFHSISVGHLLVFRYAGDSEFHVLIFNRSATEIEYPIMHNLRKKIKDKAQVIDIDSCSSDSNNETSTRNESSSSRGGRVNLETEKPADGHDFPKPRKVLSNTVSTRRSCSNLSQVTQSKERGARAAAETFRSEKPFFIATMYATCVNSGSVSVPANFAHLHLQQRTTLVNLRVADRKSWDVKLIFSEQHQRRTLSMGWLKFASENQLKLGDVCVFELVDGKKIVMNVHIFRASQEAYSSENLETNAPCTTRSKEKSLASAKSFKAKKPSFKATMCRSYLEHGFVHVPAAFATQYLKHAVMKVTVRVWDGRTWKIQCTTGDNGKHAKLSQGWAKFVSDNHLSKGDICVFKLVNEETFEMKASIVRVSQNGE